METPFFRTGRKRGFPGVAIAVPAMEKFASNELHSDRLTIAPDAVLQARDRAAAMDNRPAAIEKQASPTRPQPPFQVTVVMEYLAGTKNASKRSSLVVMGKWSPAGLFRASPPGQPHSLMGLSP